MHKKRPFWGTSILSPLFITLLPLLVVALLDASLIDLPRVRIYLLWVIWTIACGKVFGMAAILTLVTIFLPLGIIEIGHFLIIGAPVSLASMYVIFETNTSEAKDFLSMSLSPKTLAVIAAYLSVASWLLFREIRYVPFIHRPPNLKTPWSAIWLLLTTIIAVYAYHGNITRVLPPPIASGIAYAEEITAYRKIAANVKYRLPKLRTLKLDPARPQTHIIVIGESTNRNHMSIYGYDRDTTPQLTKLKDELLIYQDVISPFTHTLPSLRTALTLLQQESKLKLYQTHSLIDFARAAGYHVSWLSNQPPLGAWDNAIAVLGSTADSHQFINLADGSEKAAYFASYDKKLLPLLDQALAQASPHKLIILHLMGTHGRYSKRYPATEAFFSGADNKQNQEIDHYDNAVRYNDAFIAELVARLQRQQEQQPQTLISMTYFSDHGEEVYDSQAYVGHDWFRLSRHLVEIPFLVWVSEGFKQSRGELFQRMQQKLDTPYMLDDFIHTFFELANIQTAHYQENLSLFATQPAIRKRKIYDVPYAQLQQGSKAINLHGSKAAISD